jgi:hypothetical protein
MAWFGRRGQEPPPEGGEDPDEAFSFLTRAEAGRVRTLAQQAFAEAGIEVVVHADYLQAADGRQFGLSNLAANCHNAQGGPKSWPGIVSRHASSLLKAMDEEPKIADLDPADVLARTYLRVIGLSTLPPTWPAMFGYARPVCGDMVELLALDFPETVTLLADEHVERFGVEELHAAGLRNLVQEPIDEIVTVTGEHEVTFQVALGSSVYLASKVLILRDVLRRHYGERDYPHGVLVCAPFRQQLAFHPITGANVIHAVQSMTGFASIGFTDSAGPVSPFLYWWTEGKLTQVSKRTDDGGLTIDATGEFGELVARLTAGGSD